jgi:hypothetical protein
MWSLGQGGGAADRHPATSPAVLAKEVARQGLGSTRARFLRFGWVDTVAGEGLGGARHGRSRGALLRRACGQA